MTRSRFIAAAVAVVLLAACGSDDDSSNDGAERTTTTSPDTTTTISAAAEAESQIVDIGEGKQLFVECRGDGSPTILLEAGDESGHEDWQAVVADLGAETRTCAYDRLGTGQSSPAEGCRGIDEIIGDLEALLEAASIEGPYVFVGASGGGYLAVEMATRHPNDTAGLVLVETPQAIVDIPPDVAPLLPCDAPTNIERRDYVAVEHAVWDDKAEIGEFPVVVISDDSEDPTNVEAQKGWLVLSPNAEQVVVHSGHDVPINEPDLVVEETLQVLETARGR